MTDALAGRTVIVVRTGGAALTVTLAVPLTPPLAAVTVNGPPGVVAVNRPARLIDPPPLTDQVNDGWELSGLPNWSRPVALNCWVPPLGTEALAGTTADRGQDRRGGVTVTLAVPLTPPLAAVTVNGPPGVVAVNRPDPLMLTRHR